MKETLLLVGGFYHLGFAVFHLFFWKLFKWKKSLAPHTAINRGVMQILNICLTFIFIAVGYISLFYSKELASTSLGRAIAISIALFWFVRAVLQLLFFGFEKRLSIILTIIFIAGCMIYFIPLF